MRLSQSTFCASLGEIFLALKSLFAIMKLDWTENFLLVAPRYDARRSKNNIERMSEFYHHSTDKQVTTTKHSLAPTDITRVNEINITPIYIHCNNIFFNGY